MTNEVDENSFLPRLPPELVFHTSQFLRGDANTLCSASLSSRIWRVACRPLLFHSITLDDTMYLSKDDPIRLFEEFLDSNPEIYPLIKVVKARLLQNFGDRGISCRPWFNDLPNFIHRRLPNAHTFEVIGLGYFHGKASETFFTDLSLITSLRRLSLIRCCISNEVLNGFVTSISGLEDVHIHNQWMDGVHTTHQFDLSHIPSPPLMPALKGFSYHNDDNTGPNSMAFLEWVGPVNSLTSLRIVLNRKGSFRRVGQLLCQSRSSLQHLELNFLAPNAAVFDSGGLLAFDDLCMSLPLLLLLESRTLTWAFIRCQADMKFIDLSSNERLQSLHLHRLNQPFVEKILHQVSSLPITKIIFTDSISGIVTCYNKKDTTIDNLLASEFPRLSEVCLIYTGAGDVERTAKWTQGVFPKLTGRGILYVMRSKTETVRFLCPTNGCTSTNLRFHRISAACGESPHHWSRRLLRLESSSKPVFFYNFAHLFNLAIVMLL